MRPLKQEIACLVSASKIPHPKCPKELITNNVNHHSPSFEKDSPIQSLGSAMENFRFQENNFMKISISYMDVSKDIHIDLQGRPYGLKCIRSQGN